MSTNTGPEPAPDTRSSHEPLHALNPAPSGTEGPHKLYQHPPSQSSSLQYPPESLRFSSNDPPPPYENTYPDDNSKLPTVPPIHGMEKLSLSSSTAQRESVQGDVTHLGVEKEPAEITNVVHARTIPEKPMVTLTEDTVNASVLEDICRLLEGVQNDKQGAKRLLKNIRNGEDAQLRLDTLQVLANIPDIPTWLRSSIFKTILHLSEKSKLIPQALMINKVETLEDDPVDSGSFGNLWMGKLEGKLLA